MNDEIEKFNALASHWWEEEGPLRTLHSINPIRFKFIENHTELKHKSILDVGCGGGILTEALAKAGGIVTGIDLAADSIVVAKEHAAAHQLNINYQHISLSDFVENHTHKFDIVTSMELLEHVEDPVLFLSYMRKILKPGGILFVSTLNRTLKSYLLGIIGAEYLLKLIPKGTHNYDMFIKPSELVQTCESLSLTPSALKGIHYNPFTGRARLINDLSVNYIAAFTLLT